MGRTRAFLVIGLVLVGVFLRAHELGSLSIHGDEIITLANGVNGLTSATELGAYDRWQLRWSWSTMPLLQLGTETVFRVLGASPLTARILPFLCGVLALLLFPPLARRLLGDRAGLVTLALLAVCPLHIEMCRLARYQSPAFLCGGLTVLAVALYVEERRPRWAVLGLLCAGLAVAAHLASLLLVAAVLGFLLRGNSGRGRVLAAVVVMAAILCALVLEGGVTAVVLSGFRRSAAGFPAWKLCASLAYNLGPLVGIVTLYGALQALRGRAPAGTVLLAGALVPLLLLGALSLLKDIGPRYYAAAAPALLLLGAFGIAHLCLRSPRRAILVTTVLCLAQSPLLLSNLQDGQRYDYRSLAAQVRKLATADDLIVCATHGALEYYLGWKTVELPRDLADLEDLVRASGKAGGFLAVPRQRGELVYPGGAAGLEAWLTESAGHAATVGSRRLDDPLYRFEIELYRLQPGRR